VTIGTLKEMHWEVLPPPAYNPDLVPSDFHLFGQQKRPKDERDLEPTMKINFLCIDGWKGDPQTFLKGA
jgi:hypothetical protein